MKIYDCFTFFNEFELLKLRMQLLNDVVDYFVIIEANKTQQGKEKEFNFEKRLSDYVEYKNKIIYIKIEDMPESKGVDDWTLEHFQRNGIMRGLTDCKPDDIILISDVDEIPNPNTLRDLVKNKISIRFWFSEYPFKKKIRRYIKWWFRIRVFSGNVLEKYPLVFEQDLFYYFLNCKSKGKWYGTITIRYKNINTPQELRNERSKLPRIKNGGWHFSYLGGIDKIFLKLGAIIEGTAANVSMDYLQDCINQGTDIYGRKGKEYEYEFIDIISLNNEEIIQFAKKHPELTH